MNHRLWLAYTILEIGLCFTPGPAVLTVVSQAVRHGWRSSLWGALGISFANLIYFALSALGVGALVAASPRLYALVRWGGIAYLAYAAVRLGLSRPGSLGRIRSAEGRPGALFAQAVATQLSSPGAIAFFVSFIAPFLDLAAPWPVWAQMSVYAATTTATEIPVLAFYGFLAARGSSLLPDGRVGLLQDRIAGACLLAAAAWLALR
jgi:homoserine/homoserine lactone efflux protein